MADLLLTFQQEKMSNIIDEVEDMCGNWWKKSKFFKDWNVPYEIDRRLFLDHQESFMCVVGRDKDGKIGAFYIGALGQYLFSKHLKNCQEIVWHVREDLQGTTAVYELLYALETIMKLYKIDLWSLCLPAEPRFERTQQMLEKRGYKLQDKLMFKRGNHE